MDYGEYQRDHYWKVVMQREAVDMSLLEDDMKCPWCKGEGSWVEIVSDELGGPRYDCEVCRGKGNLGLLNGIRHLYLYHINQHFLHWWITNISDGIGPWTIRKFFTR